MSGHLYVHIPFCRSRCGYCDFASEPIGPHLRAGRVEAYCERLSVELRECAEADLPFETVYLGGGTPTAMPEEALLALVARLAALQRGAADPEFTIEANPGTLDGGSLAALASAGVTRLSLGIQSFAPRMRAALGRRTTQGEIEDALRAVRAPVAGAGGRRATAPEDGGADPAGGRALAEWNLDLVFGIPGQTWEDAAADIDAAIAAGPPHISLYDLTYTPGYAHWVAKTYGAGAQGAAGAFAEEYLPAATARLQAAGYGRYEVSNFALPGHECRHNLAYWRGEDYLGVGASSVSTMGGERRTNPVSVAGYLAGRAPALEHSPRTRLWEKAMLGMRTTEGVDESEVLPVLDPAARDRLLSQDCLRRGCGRLRLNPAFLDVSNTVISALLAMPDEP